MVAFNLPPLSKGKSLPGPPGYNKCTFLSGEAFRVVAGLQEQWHITPWTFCAWKLKTVPPPTGN